MAAVVALLAIALLHHLPGHGLSPLAQIVHGLALLAQGAVALGAAKRARGAVHVFLGLAQGTGRLHAVLAQLLHQAFEHLGEPILLLGQGAWTSRPLAS